MDKKKKSAGSSCEYCMNYEYDEDYEYYVCTQDLDQDEMYRFITGQFRKCPYCGHDLDTYTDKTKTN